MGAGQIGGIATLLDVDFNNAAGFMGKNAIATEAQYVVSKLIVVPTMLGIGKVHYLSHALLFCAGALIEPHVVLTPALCVAGERYKFELFGGTHTFQEFLGTKRMVENMCIHKGYNHSVRWDRCSADNIALLVLDKPFSLRVREKKSQFIINRLRYGSTEVIEQDSRAESICRFYGYGSRRNGYLIPLLLNMRRVDVRILPSEKCDQMWNLDDKYLCMHQAPCITDKFGALCPDDIGSVVECSGFVYGMMASRLVDRPCGVGFLAINKYNKFITCGVDDSRDVMDHDAYISFDFSTKRIKPKIITAKHVNGDENVTHALPTGF